MITLVAESFESIQRFSLVILESKFRTSVVMLAALEV